MDRRRKKLRRRIVRLLETSGFAQKRYDPDPLIKFALDYQLDNERSFEIYRLYVKWLFDQQASANQQPTSIEQEGQVQLSHEP
jgi:hypothetical protein